MSEHKPVYRYSERKFAEALDLDIRTIKRYVAAGKIRSVKLSARCRRLEDPADFQARQAGERSGPPDGRGKAS
jgi:hypothetical protein